MKKFGEQFVEIDKVGMFVWTEVEESNGASKFDTSLIFYSN